ncbi:hypothetical protein [Coleofasciculus sp. F4-SAH-05]|uniref:hypothetical protein n=1 Tax=Coleofasciculus sp. F4-SAH-05 TaxID=3069525 RepID=UPI0032FEDC93
MVICHLSFVICHSSYVILTKREVKGHVRAGFEQTLLSLAKRKSLNPPLHNIMFD